MPLKVGSEVYRNRLGLGPNTTAKNRMVIECHSTTWERDQMTKMVDQMKETCWESNPVTCSSAGKQKRKRQTNINATGRSDNDDNSGVQVHASSKSAKETTVWINVNDLQSVATQSITGDTYCHRHYSTMAGKLLTGRGYDWTSKF